MLCLINLQFTHQYTLKFEFLRLIVINMPDFIMVCLDQIEIPSVTMTTQTGQYIYSHIGQ